MNFGIIYKLALCIVAVVGLIYYYRRDKVEPNFKNQVSWEAYLKRLAQADRKNVEELCQRLATFSQYHHLPLAVVAVGSVLNPKEGALYNDIDLLLLPLLERDVDWAEYLFARFIATQKEVLTGKIKTQDGEKFIYQPEEKSWCRLLGRYEKSRFWTLQFSQGKKIDLFIRTAEEKTTLRNISNEKNEEAKDSRAYAYKIFMPK